MAAAALIVACLAGCASAADEYTARSPVATFPTASCPPELGRIVDVAAGAGPPHALMDAAPHPVTALVCEYRGTFGAHPSPGRVLAEQVTLTSRAATALASAAASVDVTKPPDGTVNCPSGTDTTTVVTFAYAHHASVGLWWLTSGCQTIDDGRLRASILGSSTFAHFARIFDRIVHTRG